MKRWIDKLTFHAALKQRWIISSLEAPTHVCDVNLTIVDSQFRSIKWQWHQSTNNSHRSLHIDWQSETLSWVIETRCATRVWLPEFRRLKYLPQNLHMKWTRALQKRLESSTTSTIAISSAKVISCCWSVSNTLKSFDRMHDSSIPRDLTDLSARGTERGVTESHWILVNDRRE